MSKSSEKPSPYSKQARENSKKNHKRSLPGVSMSEQDHLDSTVRLGQQLEAMDAIMAGIRKSGRRVLTVSFIDEDANTCETMTYADAVGRHKGLQKSAWTRLGEHSKSKSPAVRHRAQKALRWGVIDTEPMNPEQKAKYAGEGLSLERGYDNKPFRGSLDPTKPF